MECTYELICVAYVHAAAGQIRVLFAVDKDNQALGNGEPLLLAAFRPGEAVDRLTIEGPDGMDDGSITLIHGKAAKQIVSLIEGAFDRRGVFQRERLFSERVTFQGPSDLLEC